MRVLGANVFKVALIQNQSEMAHYGYADARPLISEMGYAVELFTADNIDALCGHLTRRDFDAVVFGSNALNDKTIRAETISDRFSQAFRPWLAEKRGCLCLHQLKLGELGNPTLGFLPPPLDTIAAVVRPPTEQSADGDVSFGPRAQGHVLLLYPYKIDPAAVKELSLGFRSLPGLYWHTWNGANIADWETLLVDPGRAAEPRQLLLSAREPASYRVVVSALALDWQKQRSLLQNILSYVVEGRHNTAVLVDEGSRNTAFEYLVGTLQARKYPFKSYLAGQDFGRLSENIKNGVHSVLVLGPFTERQKLPQEFVVEIERRVTSGNLKLITLEEKQYEIRRFSVAGRERLALPLLQEAELRIQAELRNGYIDGSFWSTAETLQTLRALRQSIDDYKQLTQALTLANKHDRNGSYDEVFGVTCAFLWMRAVFLGIDADETKATIKWIRARIEKFEPRERALAYFTFQDVGLLQQSEKEDLKGLLNVLMPEKLSEIDLVVFLRAALAIGHISIISGLVSALGKSQTAGSWVDLATTANAVTTLIEVLDKLRQGHADYGDLKPRIEQMVFMGIIHIQNELERSLHVTQPLAYPWDGKASTTAMCIQALLQFEKLIDLPIQELVATLDGYNRDSTRVLAGRQALSILEELKQDNSLLRKEIENSSKENRLIQDRRNDAERKARRILFVGVPFAIAIYLLVTILVAMWQTVNTGQFGAVLKAAFIDGINIHIAVFFGLAAYLAVPWAKLPKWLTGKT